VSESGVDESRNVRAYLEQLDTRGTTPLERGRAVRMLRHVSTHRFRQRGKLAATTLLWPRSVLEARAIRRRGGELRLHLASGDHKPAGWVNIDIFGMDPDLCWDLRRGIPFPESSAKAVFLEHFLEHLTLRQGLDLLDECRRVLAPGGVIRVSVPDLEKYLRSYAGDRAFIERLRPGRPTTLLAVAEVALAHGHRSMWDEETLKRVLHDAGFRGAEGRAFGDSRLRPAPDNPLRQPESVYVEAELGDE
jgi:predicted SAM-dependent methyltransferase